MAEMEDRGKESAQGSGPTTLEPETIMVAALVVFGAALLSLVRAVYAGVDDHVFAPGLGALFAAGLAAYLAYRGRGTTAAWVLVLAIAVPGMFIMTIEGPYSPRTGLLFVAVAIAALTLGPLEVLAVAAVMAIGYWLVDIAPAQGWVDPYPIPDEPRVPPFVIEILSLAVLSAVIVRARHHARHQASRGQQQVVELIRRTPFGMALVDTDRRLRSLNPALAEAVGSTPEHLENRDLDDVGLGVLFDCALARAGEPLEMWIGKAKTPRWVEASIRPLDDGDRSAYLLVVRDVEPLRRAEAERRDLEQQLEQARRLESLGRLAGGVAHDFNNLLQVILAQADLLNSGLPAPSAPSEILAAAERAEDITKQLLTFARGQHDSASEVELDVVVRATAPLLRRLLSPGVELGADLHAEDIVVPLSRAQVDQILLNLVTNAQDAMHEGGALTIETHREHDAGRTYGVLIVRDTGTGVESDIEGRIFEPFFTTKDLDRGTGLGLSTVQGIVRAAGGDVSIATKAGHGTEVRVVLPEATARRLEEPTRAASGEEVVPEIAGRTVLLVDDDDQVRSIIAAQLDRLGCYTLTAGDGDAAEALARLHSDGIDLVISDVILRRESGPEVARRIARVLPGVEVLYISGYPPGVLAWYGLTDAGERLLPKPFSTEELRLRVHWGLEQTDHRRAERRMESRRAG
jgi:PAS domain S-box-containing protein